MLTMGMGLHPVGLHNVLGTPGLQGARTPAHEQLMTHLARPTLTCATLTAIRERGRADVGERARPRPQ